MTAHIINAGEQDVLKLELIFKAGRRHEQAKGVAGAVSQLMRDGTSKHSSKEIAEAFDFYGASLNSQAFIDSCSVTFFSLNKHVPKLLPLVHEILTEAIFPTGELQTYIQNHTQKILVNLEKVEFLAQRNFTASLFGQNHFIGYTTTESDLINLDSESLISFYSSRFHFDNCTAIIAGKVSDQTVKLIEQYFGSENFSESKKISVEPVIHSFSGKEVYEEKKDAVQSAIRIGRRFINRLHPDFSKVKVLNMIFGGYFGSRLMSNLREDKGYCYGIYSTAASFLDDAYFCVATEVNVDATLDAIHQIRIEMMNLCNQKVAEDELRLVKNYIMGTILSDTDGAFNVSEVLKHLILYNLTPADFQNGISEMMNVTSDDLIQLANRYLHPDSMIEVVVGKK